MSDEEKRTVEIKPCPLRIVFDENATRDELFADLWRGEAEVNTWEIPFEYSLDEARISHIEGLSSWEMDQVRLAISTEFMRQAAEYRARKLGTES